MKNESKLPRKLMALCATLIIVAGAIALMVKFPTADEPSYQGLSLTEWIQKYVDVEGRDAGFPDIERNNKKCKEALMAMGTNAIPELLSWLQTEGSPPQNMIVEALNKVLPEKHKILTARDRNVMSFTGFRLLGKSGQPSIPALIELTKHIDPMVRIDALSCLRAVQADPQTLMPVLKRCESDPDKRMRTYAAAIIISIQFETDSGDKAETNRPTK